MYLAGCQFVIVRVTPTSSFWVGLSNICSTQGHKIICRWYVQFCPVPHLGHEVNSWQYWFSPKIWFLLGRFKKIKTRTLEAVNNKWISYLKPNTQTNNRSNIYETTAIFQNVYIDPCLKFKTSFLSLHGKINLGSSTFLLVTLRQSQLVLQIWPVHVVRAWWEDWRNKHKCKEEQTDIEKQKQTNTQLWSWPGNFYV